MKEVEKESNADTTKEVAVALSYSVLDSSCNTTVPKLGSVHGRTTGPTRRSTKGGWTEKEDETLTKAVKIFNGKNWKKIAELFPGRTDVQCLHRWQKVLNPDLVKGPWTKEEDDQIIELVEKYGCKKWCVIAQSLPGRIGKQCRERWHNHLNPAIKKDAWTKEEELALIRAHQIYGNKWAEIARFLPGRADNSIKNHWNCSVKKKLDSYSACGSSGDLPLITFPDFDNHETKAECIRAVMVGQSPGTLVSLDQKMDMESGDGNCLQGSVLGNANGSQRHPQPIQNPQIEICRSSREGKNRLTKPSVGTECDDTDASANGLIKHCGDDASMPDGSHLSSAIQSKVSCGTSSGFTLKLNSNKCLHEPGDCTNLSSSNPSLGLVTLAASSLNLNLGVTEGIRRNTIPPKVVVPVTAKRSFDSPKRPRNYLLPLNGSIITDTRFNYESYNNSSCLPTSKIGSDNSQVGKQNKVPGTPLHLEDVNFGCLCYEPPQLKDLNNPLANGRFSTTDNYIRQANNPVCYSTPPSHVRSVSVNSPESILRNAAKTFRRTPSIIRKRGREIFRQEGNSNDSDGIFSPEVRTSSSNDTLGSTHSYLHDHDGQDDIKSTDLLNVKRLFLSPPNSLKSDASTAVKSIEKCLEYAFDKEWDYAKAKLSTSATASDSSDANRGASTMLISSGNSPESMRVESEGLS